MLTVSATQVTLNLEAHLAFLPLATVFVEKAAVAFGLSDAEALDLTLATEEIFVYLCAVENQARRIRMLCQGGGYYVKEDFVFEATDFNMRAFNLTARASLDDYASAQETGLLIASRMVDGFTLSKEEDGLRLSLIKEKAYPTVVDSAVLTVAPIESFAVRPPDPEELKLFVRMAKECYPAHLVPESFGFPGKVVDMVACGDYASSVAIDDVGNIGGGLIWRPGDRMVDFSGPYVFNQPSVSGIAEALIEFLIGSIARTRAIGLINRRPTDELPEEYFELLGSMTFRDLESSTLEVTPCYRHLEEDRGISVWTHASFEPFLVEEYRRLAFARELRQVRDDGEASSPNAVLSAELNRNLSQAVLHPKWWGADAGEVLAAHVETLSCEGFRNLMFIMDLGKPWHCNFAPALASSAFEPRVVLPYAGRADVVIFQHIAGNAST